MRVGDACHLMRVINSKRRMVLKPVTPINRSPMPDPRSHLLPSIIPALIRQLRPHGGFVVEIAICFGQRLHQDVVQIGAALAAQV